MHIGISGPRQKLSQSFAKLASPPPFGIWDQMLAVSDATPWPVQPDGTEVSVDFDLLKSQLAPYFLSTTHEQDQASYYYPLQIM
jgi:hypothetical protein